MEYKVYLNSHQLESMFERIDYGFWDISSWDEIYIDEEVGDFERPNRAQEQYSRTRTGCKNNPELCPVVRQVNEQKQ